MLEVNIKYQIISVDYFILIKHLEVKQFKTRSIQI